MEAHIDDIIVKIREEQNHIGDFEKPLKLFENTSWNWILKSVCSEW